MKIPVSLLLFTILSCQSVRGGLNASLPEEAIHLTRPIQGAMITENTPTFTWSRMDCESYTIWIDGIKMDSVPASQNWYLPFPMSYGPHQWFVVAHGGEYPIQSNNGYFTISDAPLHRLPDRAVLLREDWEVASSLLVGNDGIVLSGKSEVPGPWKSTSVPATALSVMVRNGLYPNQYTGLNNMQIPDLNDAFNEEYDLLQYSHIPGKNPWKAPYWYRKNFTLPEDFTGRQVWLTLGEINYRAEVWLNGTLLADTSRIVGMERQFRLNITEVADFSGENTLAMAIYPPDHPGKPAPPPLTPLADPGTNMADGMISKDYTKWDVLGWDWIPAVRDRDMGITEDVYVHATDEILLDNLYVTSDLPLPDTSSAIVTISADLINLTDKLKKGTLQGIIAKEHQVIEIRHPFVLEPGDTLQVVWNKEQFPQLLLEHPRLWWPNGYGAPELYQLHLEAQTESGDRASENRNFGIREVETYLGPKERVYKINGRDIYVKGGNWVQDMTLNWTANRYNHEILLTKNANLNMLRIWGPGGAPPEAFYDAADKHGIMLWQDFLNDFWGTFRNTPGYSPEESLFRKATISITKKYRNHPSLVIWSSGNEGPNPREELIMNEVLPAFDGRDSKHYLRISNGDGLHGGGPYHTLEPEAYFNDPKLNGFSSEIGPSGVPVAGSVLKFMPDLGKEWMPGRYPLDGVWAYHDANDWPGRDLRKFSSYDNIIREYYGPTDSVSVAEAVAYLDRCQLLNYDVYRASIDAISTQIWENASGILLWKSNSAWPSMTWQIYDWYLQAHAGYYGLRKAAAPVTIFLNRKSKQVEVLNATYSTVHSAVIEATLFDREMKVQWHIDLINDLEGNSRVKLKESVPVGKAPSFLKLKITDQHGNCLADNFYWLHGSNNFRSLHSLEPPDLTISSLEKLDGETSGYRFTITNQGDGLALMTRMKVIDPLSGQELLPAFWSDNFISLLPDEGKEIFLTIGDQNLPEHITITYQSYNMDAPGNLSMEGR